MTNEEWQEIEAQFRALQESQSRNRLESIRVTEGRVEQLVDALVNYLSDESPIVQDAAVDALNRIAALCTMGVREIINDVLDGR